MAGIKGMKQQGNNKPTRGTAKKKRSIMLTDKDFEMARHLFGSISKAVEWAVDQKNKDIPTEDF